MSNTAPATGSSVLDDELEALLLEDFDVDLELTFDDDLEPLEDEEDYDDFSDFDDYENDWDYGDDWDIDPEDDEV